MTAEWVETAYSQEEKYWIWLSAAEDVGPASFARLLNHFGSAEHIWDALVSSPASLDIVMGINAKTRASLRARNNPRTMEAYLDQLTQKNITAITQVSSLYPELLKTIPGAPLTLYARGDISLLALPRKIAVVGTRHPTNDGRKSAYDMAAYLAKSGVAIVSGLAYGVDSNAHTGALEADGPTIAVLGCGLDVVYPRDKEHLYRDIAEKGLLLSEYVPGTQPLAQNFPYRNRIISGLCQGVLVIEAGERSGTRITVDYALDQGREVMALPGNIHSQVSIGTNNLIKEGCHLVMQPGDVLEYMGWTGSTPEKQAKYKLMQFSPLEKQIIDMLEIEARSLDELLDGLDVPLPQMYSALHELQVKGVLEQQAGQIYTLGITG